MKKGQSLSFRRKRVGKTNYKKRLSLLKSGLPRLVIRKTNNSIVAQVVKYSEKGDVVVAAANSQDLKKDGWASSVGNLPAAYLTGIMLAKKVKDVQEVVVDFGLQTAVAGSRLYAAVKGCADAGLNIAHSEEVLPSEDRISGKHIKSLDQAKFEEIKKKLLGA